LALIVLRFRKLLTSPKVFSLALVALSLFSFFHSFFLTFVDIISLFAVALATALARVASLEAELKTTTEALKDANTSADKAAKAAETKAKKAEKTLVETTQKQAKHEQAMVEQLDVICTSVGSKCFVLSLCLAKDTSVDMLLLAYLFFYDAVIRLKCIYFPEHFCYCFSSNLCVLNTTNAH
jgi:hypothetical protein